MYMISVTEAMKTLRRAERKNKNGDLDTPVFTLRKKRGNMVMDQERHIDGMDILELKRFEQKRLLTPEELTEYRSLVEPLNWFSQPIIHHKSKKSKMEMTSDMRQLIR